MFLVVAPGGSKSWVQRITIHGRRRDIGLGGHPLVPLAEARNMTLDNSRVARKGGNPLAERRKAKVPTFREAALATFEATRQDGAAKRSPETGCSKWNCTRCRG